MKAAGILIIGFILLTQTVRAMPVLPVSNQGNPKVASLINDLEAARGSSLTEEQRKMVVNLAKSIGEHDNEIQTLKVRDDGYQTLHLICVDANGSMGVMPIHVGALVCSSLSGRIYKANFFSLALSMNVGVGVLVGELWTQILDTPNESYHCESLSIGGAYGPYGGRVLHGQCGLDEILLFGWEGGLGGGISGPVGNPQTAVLDIKRI